jgi:hypothetical protein
VAWLGCISTRSTAATAQHALLPWKPGRRAHLTGDLAAEQVKELEGLRGEAEAARAAVAGLADKEAALARRATALAHLQKMPAELQVQLACRPTAPRTTAPAQCLRETPQPRRWTIRSAAAAAACSGGYWMS